MKGERLERLAAILAVSLLALAQLAGSLRESVNWDEFALLARAADTLATGELRTGGRPGLVTVLLIPLLGQCPDTMAVVQSARLLWVGFTFAYVAGLYLLLASFLRGKPRARTGALLGTALLVLVPAFTRWSLQVRTDQPALAFALWCGVLLMNRRGLGAALAAGLLAGVGLLATQKALYALALVGLLTLGDLFLRGELEPRREARRFLAFALGAAIPWGARFAAVALAVAPSLTDTFGGEFDTFAFYRRVLGFRVYRSMLPHLLPHLALLAGLLVLTLRSRSPEFRAWRRQLALAWAVAALGASVVLFHAAAFPYFWMTVGLFPAALFAVLFEPLRALIGARARTLAAVAMAGTLAVPSLLAWSETLRDTQAPQRESFSFIEQQLPPDAAGFHPERGLFCADAGKAMPAFFSAQIVSRFSGERAEQYTREFLERFRTRPVLFLLESYRLRQFPPEVVEFWQRHYVPYAHAVAVHGRMLRGPAGTRETFEAFVPAEYRWLPETTSGASLRVDGRPVGPGQTIRLEPGEHSLELLGPAEAGLFALALSTPPAELAEFYSPEAVAELDGRR